ncbi:hypothetical protein [Bacillus marasmi]|uniref:hypothetical protein n=1 Tax=Bacillus marasmi TaxID=1926279 RepID=UPI0011C99942|nr:hypothetical protein [Bacillus marasmi]
MNITVNINAPELAGAIQALAEALKGGQASSFIAEKVAQEPVVAHQPVVQTPIAPPVQAVPVQQAPVAPPVQAVPVQQQATPQAVPTSAPTYSMEQIAVAATQLVDAGKREDLVQLLQAFGAAALMQLPKEQYGAFATKLREMGAKI